VLASIAGAKGTVDERDAQITRSGMYAEYPAIFGEYLMLARSQPAETADQTTALEALKRGVFLAWRAGNAIPVETGLAELPETEMREMMSVLDAAIKSGRVDEELELMLAWYRHAFGDVFEHFGPVRSLDGFIRDMSSVDIRARAAVVMRTHDRGQMGHYWRGVLAEART
jgi:hypothetical protein